MIYKNSDGQWDRIDCGVGGSWERGQQAARRALFEKGVFRVEKSIAFSNYHLLVGDWSVCCWSRGDKERARQAISSAFDTYQGLKRMGALTCQNSIIHNNLVNAVVKYARVFFTAIITVIRVGLGGLKTDDNKAQKSVLQEQGVKAITLGLVYHQAMEIAGRQDT